MARINTEKPAIGHESGALRIMIVDDHKVVRSGLAALLEEERGFAVVAEANDGSAAVSLWQQYKPDITLMDLSMPGLGGVEATRAIRALDPLALVIVFSTFDGDDDVFKALSAGAKGYLLKDTEPAELFVAIRKVWSGRTYLPVDVAGKLADRVNLNTLTERELQVLTLMAAGKSNRAIASSLNISEGTVKTHVRNVLDKLRAESRTQAIAIAHKRGLLHTN